MKHRPILTPGPRPRQCRPCRRPAALALAAALCAALGAPARAAPVTWQAGATFWDLASSWSPGLPGVNDDAILGTFDSTFRSGTVAIRSFTGTGRLTLSGGSLAVSSASSIGALTHSGGTLGGAGAVVVTGGAVWSGGTMTGLGSTRFEAALDLSGVGTRSLTSRNLDMAGTTTWSNTTADNGRILTGSAATLNNSGSFLDQNAFANVIFNGQGGAASRFVNGGSYAKTGAGTSSINIAFDNSGSVDVQAGTLRLGGGGSSSGSFNIASGATLEFSSGTHTLTGGAIGPGTGRLVVSSGTVNSSGALALGGSLGVTGGTLTLVGTASTPTFEQTAGTLDGAGSLTVAGNAVWSGGVQSGAGSTRFDGALDLSGAGTRSLVARTVDLAGTTVWANTTADNGRIITGSAATLNNSGSFLDQNAFDNLVFNGQGGATSRFVNRGSYLKSGGAVTTINIGFEQSGSLDVQAGQLRLGGGGNVGGGSINVAAGATLDFSGGTHALGATTFGPGTGRLLASGGTVNSSGPLPFPGTLGVTGGSFNIAGTATVARFEQSGGTLGGAGSLAVSGDAVWASNTQAGTGTTRFNGALDLTGPGTRIATGRTVQMAGTTTWANINASNGRIQTGSAATLHNLGSFNDQNAFDNLISNNQGGAASRFLNDGSYAKTGAGETTIALGFTNTGSLTVAAGSLRLTGGLTNFSSVGGTLTSGSYTVIGASSLAFSGANVLSNAATLVLDGAGSSLLNSTNGADALAAWATNAAAGRFSILNGRNFTSAGNFANAGVVTVGGGSRFTVGGSGFSNQAGATLALAGGTMAGAPVANAGRVSGFGTLAGLTNSGSVLASGGTLQAPAGIQGNAGSVRIEAGASLDLAAAAATSTAATLSNAGSLALGTQAFNVFGDYDNASFGSANAFDRRANVSGSGALIGVGAGLALAGELGNPAPGVYTLDFGTVRGGGSVTRSFVITHPGGGAAVRGALQTAGAASITDPRLSGSAFVATVFGPLAAGASSTSFNATLQGGGAGGALAGQSLRVVGNFDNLAPLTVQLSGFSTVLAQGALAPAGPLDLGNFRLGGVPASVGVALGATNLASGSGAESLAVLAATASGNFSASNNLGSNLVAPGVSAPAAIAVATSSGVAGLNSGSVSVQFGSNGQAFEAAFGTVPSNSQTVALRATGYRIAQASVLPALVSLPAQRVGGGLTQALSLSNAAVVDPFSEGLVASISASGNALASGSTGLLAPGQTSTALQVGVDTTSSGPRSGIASVALLSSGSGSSGLADLPLPAQSVTVQGNVWQPASPNVQTAAVDFGIVRVGDSVAPRIVTVTNAASGALTDTLIISLGGGTGPLAASGSAQLGAGAGSGGDLTVRLETTSAGVFSASANLAFTSRNPEMADLALGSTSLPLSAQVNQLARAAWSQTGGPGSFSNGAAGAVLDFGSVLQGSGPLVAQLRLANDASAASPADALAGSFDLSAVVPGAGFTLSGFQGFAGLQAGQGLGGLLVALDTAALGSFDAWVLLNPVSTNGSGPDLALAPLPLLLRGNVLAVPEPGTGWLLAGGLVWLARRLRPGRPSA